MARLAAVSALVLSVSAANAQAPPPSAGPGAAISDLTGLSPAAVRARLAAVPADWPVPASFDMATPDGLLTFITLDNLMLDPALAKYLAVFRTQGDPVARPPYLACQETLTHRVGPPEPSAPIVLMFRNGRLESAFRPIVPARLPPPSVSDRNALAYMRRPVDSPFIAHPGELPLEDGLGFLPRWTNAALTPDDRLSATCSPPTPPRPPASAASGSHGLSASDMQGLALLPFAITLPAQNHQRAAARERGAALLASLHAGEMLGATPQKFAADHPGVRAYPAKDSDYAVLSIDMGGYPGRNLTNFNDVALVGVRAGRVEWLSAQAFFGPAATLLCLDEHGVPSTPRRGCSGWGHFSP